LFTPKVATKLEHFYNNQVSEACLLNICLRLKKHNKV